MLNFPALDVALGLVFLYFILALVCSGINEAIASVFRWRAQDLERGVWELLQDPEEGSAALEKLKAHPLIRPMLYPRNKSTAAPSPPLGPDGRPRTSRKTDFPSYIPSRTFVTALLGLEQEAVSVAKGHTLTNGLRTVDNSINHIPSKRAQQALTALLHGAQGDAVAFRRSAEQWYDDQMERVSGWYRRRIAKVLWLLAFLPASGFADLDEPRFPNPINVTVPRIATDLSVRYDYDIAYVRAPRAGDEKHKRFYTDFSQPVTMEPGADLMLLHPDGTEELLVAGGAYLAHQQDIEQGAERLRHLKSDRHAAARQGQYDWLAFPVRRESGGELPSGVAAVAEQRFEERHLGASFSPEMITQPARRMVLDFGERTCFFEQMAGAFDDDQLFPPSEPVIGHAIKLDDLMIEAPDDQQCRREDVRQGIAGEIRTSAA